MREMIKVKIYVLDVDYDDFEYDEVTYVVVLAKDEEQATEIARKSRNVKWVVDKVIDLDDAEPQLVASYLRHG